jgi:hypothetical protein
MADIMKDLVQDSKKLTQISQKSLDYARKLPTWDDQAKKFSDIVLPLIP